MIFEYSRIYIYSLLGPSVRGIYDNKLVKGVGLMMTQGNMLKMIKSMDASGWSVLNKLWQKIGCLLNNANARVGQLQYGEINITPIF